MNSGSDSIHGNWQARQGQPVGRYLRLMHFPLNDSALQGRSEAAKTLPAHLSTIAPHPACRNIGTVPTIPSRGALQGRSEAGKT